MGLLIAKHIKKELSKEFIKTLNDEDKLMEIIKNDNHLFEIRELATKQITNNDLLKEIIFDTSDTIYTKSNIMDIRETAVKQITDEKTLFEIVNKYYEGNVKYGLNVVKNAVKQITDEDMLLEISKNNYDQEIIDSALSKVNKKHETHDATKIIKECDDDTKIKRMHAIGQVKDEDILTDIALNGKYLDVREKALDKLSSNNDKVILLNNILIKEKEYNEAVNEYVMTPEDNEENKQKLSKKAKDLGVEYKKIGNTNKEKFYNQQSKLFKN